MRVEYGFLQDCLLVYELLSHKLLSIGNGVEVRLAQTKFKYHKIFNKLKSLVLP